MSTLMVAAVQAAPVFLDRSASVDKACRLIAEAGGRGARIIGFPEGFIPAHPYWFHFEPAVNRRARQFGQELLRTAITVPGPEVDALCEAAREAEAYVVMGVCERSADASFTLYNSQLFITPKGVLAAKHQKLVPTHAERVVHAPGLRRYALACIDTPWGGLGGLICGEHSNTLARFALIALKERFHVGSWPANFSAEGARALFETKNINARAHSLEGNLVVINAAGVLNDQIKAMLCDGEGKAAMCGTNGGGSAIVGPGGDYLAGPLGGEEQILYGEVDLDAFDEKGLMRDITGHYQRADVFHLTVNCEDTPLLEFTGVNQQKASAVNTINSVSRNSVT
ncbi:MAG: carbon-nitrogen hydrolase family protein [Candidatus Binatia bacterium]|nr:carbon-nitrogen hydrolase family protein [Candidatus Binatia bacterium]